MTTKTWALACTAALSCAAGHSSIAADATGTDESNSLEMKEIIVTAQKTAEDASKIPIALSVFSGDELRDNGVFNVSNLQNIAPSLSVASASHGPGISIRGVATTDVTSKGDQGVVFNVDGVPVGRPEEMAIAFFDVARVEILRGPQGTLYGKSATGGAINVITNKPQEEFDASANVEFGNFNTRRAEAMVNVPLNDQIAFRFSGSFNKRDGFLLPTLGNTFGVNSEPARNDEDNGTARLQGLWKFADAGSVLLTGTVGHIGGVGNTTEALYNSVINEKGAAARTIFYNPMAGGIRDNFQNVSGEFNIDLGSYVHLTYVGARQHFDANDNYDASSNDPAANGNQYGWQNYVAEITTTSHELRFSNAKPGRLTWVAGGNYYKEFNFEDDQNWNTLSVPFGACPYYAPNLSALCNVPNPGIYGPTQHTSKSGFGQASFSVTDALKLTVGARYSSDSLFRLATIAAGPGPFFDAAGNPCAPPNACVGGGPGSISPDVGSQSASKVTWRVGVDYQLTPDQLVYGSVATGYKAGGFNDFNPGSQGTAAYGPESLIAYEIGYKGRVLPNVQFNSSLYYYDYSKYDLTGATFLTPNLTGGPPNVVIYTKLVPATFYGWENELNWNITKSDLVKLNLSLQKAYYKNDPNTTVGFLYNVPVYWGGKSLDNTPIASGTVSYEHRWIMASSAAFSAELRSKISSKYYESDLAGNGAPFPLPGTYSVLPAQYTQSTYTRTDFNLGYTSPTGKFTVGAFVRNIEDKLQLSSAPQTLVPAGGNVNSARIRVTDPRTFGIRLGIKY